MQGPGGGSIISGGLIVVGRGLLEHKNAKSKLNSLGTLRYRARGPGADVYTHTYAYVYAYTHTHTHTYTYAHT